ncbi:hypothetical protein [Thermaerobacter composti]|uniref:Uncharacterized protein n=1 Tax=Thermaerobacter composti TaxID=554949 RepID=A0ABZ0QMS2_9FIRM|nr:hypothetical protein [Thermaerobacter composti]WPD17979.1 hypothetical protein Q5761_06150 [Thermaerobacter composti]
MKERRRPLVIEICGKRYRWRGFGRRRGRPPAPAPGKVIWLEAYRRRSAAPQPEGAA